MVTKGVEIIQNPLSESALSKKGLCDYVINVAAGCLHGCTFCYVPSTPAIRTRADHFNNLGVENPQMDWGKYLFVREDLPAQLESVLSRKKTWKVTPAGKGVVLLCSGTDPYQNKHTASITRQVIQVLLAHGKRIRILTRSPLWINDLDLLVHPNVTVGMSLPHLDDSLSRQVEPSAPLPSDRLKALQKGKEAGCRLYIAAAPTPPMHKLSDFLKLCEVVAPLKPEVMFWEPINSRGTNGLRMVASGLDWAVSVMSRDKAVEVFERQAKSIACACAIHGIPLHIWPDAEIAKHLAFDVNDWFDLPSVEVWN